MKSISDRIFTTRQIGIVSLVMLLGSGFVASQAYDGSKKQATAGKIETVLLSDVKWEKLNPARGDKSPKAGTLWGNRKIGQEPTGFLAQFVDGFSSPPHIHNRTYRAVVIHGFIHNDDPAAARMWMQPGSFWTQPKGESHITAAKGKLNMALVEIDKGPYLVRPSSQAFDSGERPINIDASNVIWVDQPGMPVVKNGPKIVYLWGQQEGDAFRGTFVKLPAGLKGKISSDGPEFRGVVIKGQPTSQAAKNVGMEPGSYFGSMGKTDHLISSAADSESIIYIRTNGNFQVTADN